MKINKINLTIGLFLAVAVLTGAFLVILRKDSYEWKHLVSEQDKVARHRYIREHVTSKNVHPFLRPVHVILEGSETFASGTLVLTKEGKPNKIITANHIFSEIQPGSGYYDYEVLTPRGYVDGGHISSMTLDSLKANAGLAGIGIQDIAIGEVGPKSLIGRTSKIPMYKSGTHASTIVGYNPDEKFQITSVTTGEQFDIVGVIFNSDGMQHFVMLYDSVPGESGSGFWSNDRNQLFVLSGTFRLPDDMCKNLGVPEKFMKSGKLATLLCGVDIKW